MGKFSTIVRTLHLFQNCDEPGGCLKIVSPQASSFRHSFGKLYSYQLLQMRTSETFTTGYFSREKQLLEKMKQNSTNGYVHEQALAAILRMPTDTANSPVALIDVHSFRVT